MDNSNVTHMAIMSLRDREDMEIVRWILAHDFVRFWLKNRLFLFVPEEQFDSDWCRKIVQVFNTIFCEVNWND